MLRVCYPFVGDTIGGSHVSATQLIAGLPRSEVEPIVALHRSGPLEGFLAERGIGFEWCPGVRLVEPGPIVAQIVTMLRAAAPLAAFLRHQRIDVVHSNDARMHLTWGLAARLAGTRFVWHQRSAEDSRRLGVYSRLADTIITISNHCRSTFPPAMARRARAIENPFDTDAEPPDRPDARATLLAELGAPGDATVVGFVGNLTDQKRPLVFVETAARLRDCLGEEACFPMFGDPRAGLRQTVEQRIEALGLAERCLLMGARFPIEPWIAGCDCLVAPAVNEGSGRAPIEAMLVGTPVVAADHGGHREIIDHGRTGLLVAPDDADAFADAVMTLLSEPLRAAHIAGPARTAAMERFSTARHVAAVLLVYRGLVT
ncbi:MAG: glycosyltransferase [Kiloniellales bacterium]